MTSTARRPSAAFPSSSFYPSFICTPPLPSPVSVPFSPLYPPSESTSPPLPPSHSLFHFFLAFSSHLSFFHSVQPSFALSHSSSSPISTGKTLADSGIANFSLSSSQSQISAENCTEKSIKIQKTLTESPISFFFCVKVQYSRCEVVLQFELLPCCPLCLEESRNHSL